MTSFAITGTATGRRIGLQGLRGQAPLPVLPAPDQVSAGAGRREEPFHRGEPAVGDVDHPGPEGVQKPVGQLVLALVIGARFRGDPAAAGGADVPDDPQQGAPSLAGGPEFAVQGVVAVQFRRGAVDRGDFQAVPQGAQPHVRVGGFRVDLEQAAHGVLAEPLPGLGQGAGRRDRPGPGPQAGNAEDPGQHPVIALAGKQAGHHHADQGHLRVQRRLIPPGARCLCQRPLDRVPAGQFLQKPAPVQVWRALFTDYRRPLDTFEITFRAATGLYFFKRSFT